MMHAITRAMFPDNWRGLLAHGLRVRHSRRFRELFLALTVLLGSTSVLHAATATFATWNANPEPDIAGYILSYGTSPGVHPTSVDVKNVTTWQLTTLTPGQTYYFVLQAYNTSALTSVNSAEVVFTVPAVTPPSLTSLTPTSGAVGTSVTIAGTDFGATQGTSTVLFNGTAATPTSWGATSIVVPVPGAATTGPVVVTVGGEMRSGHS
jgi:hypothetical protein